jgi:nucleoside-diphosphate-sugar epimerase
MRVLIIGGTGLISVEITRLLVERGDDVTLFNRGATQSPIPEEVKQVRGDRKDFVAFERRAVEFGRFDAVIDMVCFLPEEAESAVRVFRGRTNQFIFCSTVDVYTKPASLYPIAEGAERQPSRSFPYAYYKAICESIFERAHVLGDIPVTIIRPAQTYGEGRGLVHTMGRGTYYFDRFRKGKPIIVHGDGTSLWAACHRDDVARAFVNALGNPKAIGKAYHTTGEEWMTWDRYNLGVAEAMGVPAPRLVHIPSELLGRVVPKSAFWCVENFKFNNIFDNRAARDDLGFQYTVPWVGGVQRVVRWLDEHQQIESSDGYPFYDRVIEAWERLGVGMSKELAGVEERLPR